MVNKRPNPEEIDTKLRQVEVQLITGFTFDGQLDTGHFG
jgi:hypothetical protein